ncbi:TetR/AcrR family transcriptional regulator [bacterium 1XD42-94]|nr:TetR/AcrR family transcriptional regulator [bacterium 1XD42-76]NBK04433.1 TetR/AcrR family transcriptional regulator [bacterium 1XD42-94]
MQIQCFWQSWTQYGYKKTGIDDLCRQAGISKGAFYIFFESKEALFCEVLCSVQEQICDTASAMIEKRSDKYGVAEALKFVYREYDRNNFLYSSDSKDFTVLMNKLSEEQIQKIEASNYRSRQLFLGRPNLKLKVDAELAVSVIYSLIMNVKNKEVLLHNHTETFDFMADHLIDSLYQ